MKKLYFLLLFAFSFITNAQIVNIPDANFKAKLLSASSRNYIASTQTPNSNGYVSSYNIIDTNGDKEIQVSEAKSIKYLRLMGSNISNLDGIEYFSNLMTLDINGNNLSNLDLTNNVNIFRLDVSNNNFSSLDVSSLKNLKLFYCSENQFTNLDISQNFVLEVLGCESNQLIAIDVSQNKNLKNLSCAQNQLTSLDVSQNLVLEVLSCYNNQLTAIDVSKNLILITLTLLNNQLTSINVSQNSVLQSLDIENNLLTSLNVSQSPGVQYLNCSNNPFLESLFIKNGNVVWGGFNIQNNPNLRYVCADKEDINMVQQLINNYGYNCHVNSYCTFTPGGTFYEIAGNTKFDFDTNGCDLTDINYPNLKYTITDGTATGSFITNTSGDYSIPIQAGTHTITPILENPSYFNISPSTVNVTFPSQASPFTQDFCVTPNGVHSDVEVTVIPVEAARPGFNAPYKIVYKNKGNQNENGSVNLTFDDTKMDYVSSNPVFNSQATNQLTWNYTNLQPFETRTIDVVFNINSANGNSCGKWGRCVKLYC